MSKFMRSLDQREIKESPMEGASGGLEIIWDLRNIAISSLEVHKNQMSGKVKGIGSNSYYRLFNVYGPTHNGDKSRLLNEEQINV